MPRQKIAKGKVHNEAIKITKEKLRRKISVSVKSACYLFCCFMRNPIRLDQYQQAMIPFSLDFSLYPLITYKYPPTMNELIQKTHNNGSSSAGGIKPISRRSGEENGRFAAVLLEKMVMVSLIFIPSLPFTL